MSGSSSPLSSLSSAPHSDNEMPEITLNDNPMDAPSPTSDMSSPAARQNTPKRKREPSPPHEETLADNEDVAFIVMFRSRFSDAFPTKLIQFGPQDIENGVAGALPSAQVESLLCALLALVLNRKKPIERGHHTRALEEAISSHKSQWPPGWNKRSPLSGQGSFDTMLPVERLTLIKAVIMWSLHSSEAIKAMLADSYKQSRHDDDLNQPLSVQPWGRDGEKRRYWLIEGRDDTPFRLYRESNPLLKRNTWRSIAGTIEELRTIAKKLAEETSQASRRLSTRIMNAIPRFEATEEKRKRREYRQSRKAQFVRPDPGFGMYEGRTRGKRLRYTYSDEGEGEGDDSGSADTNRRSTRNSGVATPADPSRPTVTASGRQVRSRMGGMYGESLLSGHADTDGASATENYSDVSEQPGRPTRASRRGESNGRSKPRKQIEGYNSLDELDDEDDAMSSGHDWDAGDEDDADDNLVDEDEDDMSGESEDQDIEPKSLIVTLRYMKSGTLQTPATTSGVPEAAQSLASPITEAPSSKVPATGQPTPSLNDIHHDPPVHASSLPVAAPPGMIAVNPASPNPPDALPSKKPQYHAQPGYDVHQPVPSPAPVSTI
ncbi:hypothetical protein EG328_009619 [Venturia inaequalis]|uniref:WHIM1 domain-containing protein n=1 Tax=Venturia inaequalis TaxID=5025 RepID=A0A8H3V9P4_VENIN|nr:hypothetical protein EG328_009619 [Venturia inaequalis]KAE9993202.1 hypothetical protein EG327_006003 [Venturia inaequalis]